MSKLHHFVVVARYDKGEPEFHIDDDPYSSRPVWNEATELWESEEENAPDYRNLLNSLAECLSRATQECDDCDAVIRPDVPNLAGKLLLCQNCANRLLPLVAPEAKL